jgi:type II secretory pathway component GspD/PulD (secretin)
MKIGTVLPLSLVLASACTSTPSKEGPSEPTAPPTSEGAAGAQEGGAAPQDFLAQESERLTLAEQKKKLIVEQHLATAADLKARGRLDAAEAEVVAALNLDPDNLAAKQELSAIAALLGKSPQGIGQAVTDVTSQYAVRMQQLRAEGEDALRKGKLLLTRGDYDGAIAELSIAENHVRWAPYTVDWQGMDKEIQTLLAQAKSGKAQAEEAARLSSQRETYERIKAVEQADKDRRAAIIDNMIEQSIEAFERGDYEKSQEYAQEALRKDPRNEKAQDLRDSAFKAGREQVRADYIAAKSEQFRRWREELADARIPYSEVYTLPDADFWQRITEIRGKRPGLDQSSHESETEKLLREKVRTTRIPGLIVDTESLSVVIDSIRQITGLPLVVDPAAENEASTAGAVFKQNLQNAISVQDALNLTCSLAGETVTWTIKHDAILVTTKAKARGRPLVVNHDVNDLVFGLTDFLGPRIDRLRLLADMTDEDGGGPFGGVGEKPNLIEISQISTLIQENVAPGTWEEEGISIDEGEGYLMVVHTPEVQKQVTEFLNDLRRFSSSLVAIDSKFMTVGSNWIQEIGVDFRGLENPGAPFKNMDDLTNGLEDNASKGLDNNGTGAPSGQPSSGMFYDDGRDGDFKVRTENFFGNSLGQAISTIGGLTTQLTFLNDLQVSAILRAVEKSQDFQLINDQMLSVHNTQRAYVSVVNQQAYIQDFDVEVAQFQAVADPQINILTEGVVLDVRPTIHHDRKYLTREIQPTVAKVVNLRNFSSTLGGNTSPVEFQLPELQVQSVFTTAVIADGASILLGGLSNIRNIERRAEVPWLAKVPFVGWLFRNEGYNEENKSLMILIRARITDVNDELKRLENQAR